MKIVLIGASGTIGRAVHAELSQRHEVVGVNSTSGDFRVDIADRESIRQLYARVGAFDAVVSAAGKVHFGPLEQFTAEQFDLGLHHKLMGHLSQSDLKDLIRLLEKLREPLTVSDKPIPHRGGVRHSLPPARKSGRPSASSRPMSCSNKSVNG